MQARVELAGAGGAGRTYHAAVVPSASTASRLVAPPATACRQVRTALGGTPTARAPASRSPGGPPRRPRRSSVADEGECAVPALPAQRFGRRETGGRGADDHDAPHPSTDRIAEAGHGVALGSGPAVSVAGQGRTPDLASPR
ncbi:hypothetical protein [Streptomyces sp. NPDC006355]|uniref:hypothetical protein n=1 Tax=Streptomyces sp. NPDC006355 TaxID=3156758 RepID=UPI0033B07E38